MKSNFSLIKNDLANDLMVEVEKYPVLFSFSLCANCNFLLGNCNCD